MLRNVLFLARSDLARTLRHKETWIWTFVMPIVFFYFFSTIQGGPGDEADERDALVMVVPDDGGWVVDELERRLAETDFAVTRVRELEATEELPARVLRVPAGFGAAVLNGESTTLHIERAESGNAGELDRFRVSRAAYSVLADVVASVAAKEVPSREACLALGARPRSLQFDIKPAGERRTIPSGRDQSIPGTLVMFTMIVLLTSGAIGIVIDRRLGLLRRLASAPLSRVEILLGKWLGVLSLGLVQIAFSMVVGTLLFGLDWGPDLAMVALVLLFWAAFVTSLALLVASFTRTEGQVIGIGVLTSNVLAALGGCWWPIEITPRWMQQLSSCLPTGWVMNALHRLVIFQTGASGAVAALVCLASGAFVLGALAARRFRFH